jgi:integrase
MEQGRRTKRGKHPEKVLTATRVRALAEPGRYLDGNGLYLEVEPSGAKRWTLRTVIHGKRCDVGLGGLSIVSLAQARDEAVRLRKIARDGGDPIAEKRKARQTVPTFEEAARQVHESQSKSFRNEKHKAQWLATLDAYVFTVFGSRRVDHVDSSDVLKALSPIWLEIPETARRVRQRIKTVFDWAKAAGFRSGDNPVEGVSKVLPKHDGQQEHFAAMPYAQVPAFIQKLREYEGVSTKLAFELLILTAARTSEVLKAKWTEFNLDGKMWIVPADRMKAKREHRVPLSARCIEILEAAKEIADGGEHVFPGAITKKPLSNMAFNMALRHLKQTNCTPHGFRSSFRDWAEERTNYPRSVTEAALAHAVKDKVEAAYRRTDLFDKRRKLMDAWSAFASAVSAAKVISIGEARVR